MSSRPLIIIAVVFAAAIALKLLYWFSPPKVSRVLIAGAPIIVEVARTVDEQTLGLSNRLTLPEGHGMLFVYGEKMTPRFWMKDMRIPLDFMWIVDGKIAEITVRVPAPQLATPDSALPLYTPSVPVTMALEVNAGTAERLGWKVGDAVTLEL
ncbi:DUF192 domain-containing protein [Candidatus Uhrbacteria bacterium]|nr:DUF192 domain-containing protein [Candidatus Uhrbacteria bacterium]